MLVPCLTATVISLATAAAATPDAPSANQTRSPQAHASPTAASMLTPTGIDFIDVANLPFTDTNDTTGGGDIVNYVPNFCAARGNVDGPERIYRFVPQEGADVTFTATPLGDDYDIAIYLMDSLQDGKFCLIGADDHGPGEAESFSFSDRFRPGVTYYLHIDSFYGAAANPGAAQGAYRVELNGSLPVELLQFGVD